MKWHVVLQKYTTMSTLDNNLKQMFPTQLILFPAGQGMYVCMLTKTHTYTVSKKKQDI